MGLPKLEVKRRNDMHRMTGAFSKSRITTDTKILPKLDHKKVMKRRGNNRMIGDFNAFPKLQHKSEHYRKDLPNIEV